MSKGVYALIWLPPVPHFWQYYRQYFVAWWIVQGRLAHVALFIPGKLSCLNIM